MQHITKRFYGQFAGYLAKQRLIKRSICVCSHYNNIVSQSIFHKQKVKFSPANRRILESSYHDEYELEPEEIDIYQEQPKLVKHTLYQNHDDPLLPLLNACASIQEVFEFLKKYDKIIQPLHLSQVVLVLRDLQIMFQHVSETSSSDKIEKLMKDYMNELQARSEFKVFLDLILKSVDQFEADPLACMYIYLNKLGVNINHKLMKALFKQLSVCMERNYTNMTLATLNRYMISTFINKTTTTTSSGIIDKLLPIINNNLELCNNAEDLKLLSMCLNVLHENLDEDIIEKFKIKLENMLEKEQITSDDTEVLIKSVLTLNYPPWRDKYMELKSKCFMMLKPNMGKLSLHDVIVLNEIFIKNQEPADVLYELQRVSSKYLRELDETENSFYVKRLRLVSALILFASPMKRPESEEIIRKYSRYKLNGNCLLELAKSIQFARIMDPALCKGFWDRVLVELEHDDDFKRDSLLKVCYSYLSYNQNISYRHSKLEKRLNQWIEGLIESKPLASDMPTLSAIASFVISYGNDVSIVNYVTNLYRDRWKDVTVLDCISLSKSMQMGKHVTRNVHLKDRYYNSLTATIDKVISRKLNNDSDKINVNITNMMLKTYINRNQIDHPLVEQILQTYKVDDHMSSKQLKNLTMCLLLTSAFLPQIIDRAVDYICKYHQNVIAFNAEKVAFLCYYLGYIPKNCEKFSKVLVNMILRDQEKINGLSYIHGCLALCFFNKITAPLIKQIFNVRFMEKLDLELQHCYAKDVYPNRVRNNLMELNRTVCIDYPELNVPWFHQKFANKFQTVEPADPGFHKNVYWYLSKLLYDCDIECNTFTPYGYNIDFTINYKEDNDSTVKLAVLLTKSKDYTKVKVQLKGALQTKVRHLEILGYKVKILPLTEWNQQVYGENKIAYLRSQLGLPNRYPQFYYEINR